MSSTSSTGSTPPAPADPGAQVQNVINVLNTASTLAASLDPAIAPYVIIGQAVAAALPSIVDDVNALINGTAVTDAQVAALAAQITGLANPAKL